MSAFGNLSSLSAVTGERVEYWVPGSVMDSLGLKGAMAVCIPTLEHAKSRLQQLLRHQEYLVKTVTGYAQMWGDTSHQSERAARVEKSYKRRAALASGKTGAIEPVLKQMEADERRLRDRGVKGIIPVCLYRSTGKKAGTQRWMRRSVAIHERFHAEMRRLEARNGLQPYQLWAVMDGLMDGTPHGREARRFAIAEGWASRQNNLTEEILARVEEIRQSCVRSQADCQDISDEFHLREQRFSGRVGQPPIIFDHTMYKLTQEITKRYGGALAFAGAALKAFQKTWEGRQQMAARTL